MLISVRLLERDDVEDFKLGRRQEVVKVVLVVVATKPPLYFINRLVHCISTLHMRSFLDRSSPDESKFLESLVNSFTPAFSQTPTDLGCFKKTNHSMDIELVDPSSPLPLDLPIPTSPNMNFAS